MAYQFEHAWAEERRRLAQIEKAFDPWTTRVIESLEPKRGWRCLEVGGGGGSIAEWLCRRVGPDGIVVATDLETKFLSAIEESNLEVRQHNILSDPLEESHYDLIHARAVLDHLPERDSALQRLVAALRPGGWVVIEGGDFSTVRATTHELAEAEFFRAAFAAVIEASRTVGMDPSYGSRLGEALRAAGTEHVRLEGFVLEWNSDHPLAALYGLTFQRLREVVLAQDLLSATDLDRLVRLMGAPEFRALSHTIFSACGRRPTTS